MENSITTEKTVQEVKAWQFKPGQSGNPGGRPKGSRDKLQRDFLKALSEDFAEHGKEALEDCRKNNSAAYIKAVASLMPKEIEVSRPLHGLSDDDLLRIVDQLERLGAGAPGDQGGVGAAQGGEPACSLSTLQ